MKFKELKKRSMDKPAFLYRVLKRKYQKKFIIQPYSNKRKIILRYKTRFNCKNFVETGTFLGDTVNSFKNNFDSILSIELQSELAIKAIKRFENIKHIKIIEGNSETVLKQRDKIYFENTLYWLDGHYSGEFFVGKEFIKTAKADKETPIVEELKEILKHGINNNVILIDDARCFNGKADFPTIKELKRLLKEFGIYDKQVVIKKDIIRIIPE